MVGGTTLVEVMESMPAATIIGMLVTTGFAAAMVYTVWKEKQAKIAADNRRREESAARDVRLRRDAEERFERQSKQVKQRTEEAVELQLAYIDRRFLPIIALQDEIIERADSLQDDSEEIDVPGMPPELRDVIVEYAKLQLTRSQHRAIIDDAEYIKKAVIQSIYNQKKVETERVKKHFDLPVPDVKIDMGEFNDTMKNNRAKIKSARISEELLEKIYAWKSAVYKSSYISGYYHAQVHTPPYKHEVISGFKRCTHVVPGNPDDVDSMDKPCPFQATHGFTSAAEGYKSNEDASEKRMFCKKHAPDGHRFIEVRYGGGSGLYFGILVVLAFAAVIIMLICIIYQVSTTYTPKKLNLPGVYRQHELLPI
jgi:hypothetical protein